MTGQYVSNFFTIAFIVAMLAWCSYNYADFRQKIATDPFEDYELPNTMVGMGVLGTFFGVSVGLFFFDTSDITASVRSLLASMETAFFTSVAGMLLSFYLKYRQHQEQTRYYETHAQLGYADIAMLLEYLRGRDDEEKRLRREWEAKEDERRAHMLNYLREGQKSLGENLSASIAEMTKSIVGDGERSLNTSIRSLEHSLTDGLNRLQTAQKNQAKERAEQLQQVINYSYMQADNITKVDTRIADIHMKLAADHDATLKTLDRHFTSVQTTLRDSQAANLEKLQATLRYGQSATTEKLLALQDGQTANLKKLQALDDSATENTMLVVDAVRDLSSSMVQKVSEAQIRELTRIMQGIVTDFNDRVSEQFGDNFRVFSDAVGELTGWQARYREELQKLHDDQLTVLDKIMGTEKALAAVAKATDGIAYSAQTLQTITELTRDNQTELNRALAEQADFVESTEALMPTMRELDDYVKRLGKNIKTLEGKQTETVEKLCSSLDTSLKATLTRLERAATSYVDALEQTNKSLRASVDTTMRSLTAGTDTTLKALNDSTEKALKNTNKQLADSVTKASASLTESAERASFDLDERIKSSIDSLGTALTELTERFALDYAPLVAQMNKLVQATDTLRAEAVRQSSATTPAGRAAVSADGRTIVLDDAN